MFRLIKDAAVPRVRVVSVNVAPYIDRYNVRYNTTFQDTPFKDVIDKDFLSEPLSHYGLKVDSDGVQLLKSLKTPEIVQLRPSEQHYDRDRDVTAVTVNSELFKSSPFPGTTSELLPGTILVRSFYDRLAKQLLSRRWSILLGNPGISKSWFHWYLLYSIARNLRPGCQGNIQSPTVVVRQIAEDTMTYYFPQTEQAYDTRQVDPFILKRLDPSATLYLFEPVGALIHPFFASFPGKIIATCSPDERRYKEFKKNGAVKFYMPGWTLEELQLAGAYMRTKCRGKLEVDFSAKAIEDRYQRFGGIIRYVLPFTKSTLLQAKNDQDSELNRTKLVDIFAPYRSIEKADSNKENISHFVLQYDVEYDEDQYRNEEEFTNFRMQIASDYVKANIIELNDEELLESIQSLKQMFAGGTPKIPELFQTVVYQVISEPKYFFSWQIFESGKWNNHKWKLTQKERVAKDCEKVTDMKPGILYYPVDPRFPGADFVFVKPEEKNSNEKKKRAFCIQVTFQENHKKGKSVYEKLYKRLGMEPNNDEITIYLITQPRNVDDYIEDTFKKLSTGFEEADMPKLRFQVVNCNWVLNVLKMNK